MPLSPSDQNVRSLRLHSLDHQLQKLPRPPAHGVHAFWFGRSGDGRGEDVLTAQRHGPAGEGYCREQSIVIDLAQARAAILVLGKHAMVLDAEAADLLG